MPAKNVVTLQNGRHREDSYLFIKIAFLLNFFYKSRQGEGNHLGEKWSIDGRNANIARRSFDVAQSMNQIKFSNRTSGNLAVRLHKRNLTPGIFCYVYRVDKINKNN